MSDDKPKPKRKKGDPTGKQVSGRRKNSVVHGRVRIGKTSQAILNGDEDLSIWTDEELRRGQRKSKRGIWEGRPPAIVPKALHDELVKRTLDEAQQLMRDNLLEAVRVLTALVADSSVEPKDRIKAVEIVMNRVMGKAPDKVEVSGEMKPWEVVLQGGIIRDTAEDDDEEIEDDE